MINVTQRNSRNARNIMKMWQYITIGYQDKCIHVFMFITTAAWHCMLHWNNFTTTVVLAATIALHNVLHMYIYHMCCTYIFITYHICGTNNGNKTCRSAPTCMDVPQLFSHFILFSASPQSHLHLILTKLNMAGIFTIIDIIFNTLGIHWRSQFPVFQNTGKSSIFFPWKFFVTKS